MNVDKVITGMIKEVFPNLEISIYPDETEDNIIVAVDDELYYSEKYLSLVLKIKMEVLWKNNIFNYLFVKERVFISIPQTKTFPSTSNLSFDATLLDALVLHEGHTNYSESEDVICPQAA
jgi:hypothetical protein